MLAKMRTRQIILSSERASDADAGDPCGASPQIRNMATNGNLMQRTRCAYFYDVATPCNKRQPGSGCSAKDGLNRYSAIFGWSDNCVAIHPSDMCVALAALDAVVNVQTVDGRERKINFADFHRLPENAPEKDNTLAHGEMITSIDIPKNNFAPTSYYLKVRDRASYAFALSQPGSSTVKRHDQTSTHRLASCSSHGGALMPKGSAAKSQVQNYFRKPQKML